MKELPISERPYEKLEVYGEETLSNAELLAIIIKNGTKEESSVTLAQKILSLGRQRMQTREFVFFARIIFRRTNANSWNWKNKSNTNKSSL